MWPSTSAYTTFCEGASNGREGVLEALPVPGTLEAEETFGGAPRLQRGPLQREPSPDRALRILDALDDRTVAGDHHLLEHVGRALDVDDLAQPPGRLEPALGAESIGRRGVELLDDQVLAVGEGIGESPGDALVVADDHERHPGHGHAGRLEVLPGPDVRRVPDRGHPRDQVRIVAEDRPARRRPLAGDDPGVAHPSGGRDPARRFAEHGQQLRCGRRSPPAARTVLARMVGLASG